MLRSIIFCPDADLKTRLEGLLDQIGLTRVVSALASYPTQPQLIRLLRLYAPDVIFLSTESMSQASAVAREVGRNGSPVQVIGLSRSCDPQILIEGMRVGIREVAMLPFDHPRLAESLRRMDDLARDRRAGCAGSIFSFIPAKAGVGNSVVALNVAFALSRLVENKILLADLDLSGGVIRFALQLQNTYSINDITDRPIELVAGLWPYMATAIGSLDVLHAGKVNPEFQIEGAYAWQFMEFLRQRYGTLIFDMSGNFESYSLEILHESKRIFLVCTPEPSALRLAQDRYSYLSQLDLADRVLIIMNRWPKRPEMSVEQIQENLNIPVFTTLTNDYNGVQKAIAAGRSIEPTSGLGKDFSMLAQMILRNEKNAWRANELVASNKTHLSGMLSAARLLVSR